MNRLETCGVHINWKLYLRILLAREELSEDVNIDLYADILYKKEDIFHRLGQGEHPLTVRKLFNKNREYFMQ